MLLAVRISSYGCTWEGWRALKKLDYLSVGVTLTLLSWSPHFPRAYTLSMNQFLMSLKILLKAVQFNAVPYEC